MTPKTVVIVSDTPNFIGGAAKVALDSALGLNDVGIKVIIFSSQPLQEGMYPQGIDIITTDQHDILSNPSRINAALQGIWNVIAAKRFAELLDSLSPKETIIHFHSWTKSNSASLFKVVQKRKFKAVVTLHDYFLFCPNGGFFNYKKNIPCGFNPLSLRCLASNCDSRCYSHKLWRVGRQIMQNVTIKQNKGITFLSISDLNNSIIKRNIHSKAIVRLVKNPIDMDEKPSQPLSVEERKNYLFIGRLSREKGIDLFCRAVSELKVPAIVIGDGEDFDYYKNKYKLINFVGWKTLPQMQPYINKSKALIFPSLLYEASPLTTKELKSQGIPLIVADECSAKEDVVDGVTGYLFKSGNIDSLIDAIKKFETKDWNKFSEASLNTFEREEHELKNHITKLLKIYSEVL